MFTDVRVQLVATLILLAVLACLMVAFVQRTTMMRELEVDVQSRRAIRDSLDAWNSAARVDLVRVGRPDRVFQVMQDSGFVIPDAGSVRFLLYPGSVPGGDGLLTAHLAAQLRDRRTVVRGNEAWLWGWVRRLPQIRDLGGGGA